MPKARPVAVAVPVAPDGLAACCPELLAGSLGDDEAVAAARAFRALADPTRVRLLSMIASEATGEACVCDLTDGVDLSQPTVSHHLKVLVDAGLIERERRGSWAFYRVRPEAMAGLARALGG